MRNVPQEHVLSRGKAVTLSDLPLQEPALLHDVAQRRPRVGFRGSA
jgi:hypothetical protein